jgi:hypothetical protein
VKIGLPSLNKRNSVNRPASFLTPVAVNDNEIVEPTSARVLETPPIEIVGIVYVGSTVGNNRSSNKLTKVSPLKLLTVVPEGIPPTAVGIANVGDSKVL